MKRVSEPRFRPQFRLATMFLLTAVCAVLLGVWRSLGPLPAMLVLDAIVYLFALAWFVEFPRILWIPVPDLGARGWLAILVVCWVLTGCADAAQVYD